MRNFLTITLALAFGIVSATALIAKESLPAPASWMGGEDYYEGQDEWAGGEDEPVTVAPAAEYITVYEQRQVCENGVCRIVNVPVRRRIAANGMVVTRPVVFSAMANGTAPMVQCVNCGRARYTSSCVGGMSWGYSKMNNGCVGGMGHGMKSGGMSHNGMSHHSGWYPGKLLDTMLNNRRARRSRCANARANCR